MKSIAIFFFLFIITSGIRAQIIPVVPLPHFDSETSLEGQVAVRGFSGKIGDIVPLPTNPNSIGVLGIGFTGIKGEARGVNGYGVYGRATKPGGRGVYGEADYDAPYGVYGYSTDNDQISVFGLNAGGVGVMGESFAFKGVSGKSSNSDGVFGTSNSGYGVHAHSDLSYALFVESTQSNGAYFKCADGGANIILAGSNSNYGGGSDDAVIRTQPGQAGGDLILVSNDVISFHLDDDNNSDAEAFVVQNGSNQTILNVDHNGNMTVSGGYNISSDRARKEAFNPVNQHEILQKIAALPISEWQYKADATRHVGPMAQDFYQQFGLGQGETTISTVDAHGVTIAAIQALYQMVSAQQQRIDAQDKVITALRDKK